MSTEAEVIEGKLAEYLEQYPGLKELLKTRCKACKLYVTERNRKDREIIQRRLKIWRRIMARGPCDYCRARTPCEHESMRKNPITEEVINPYNGDVYTPQGGKKDG